VSRLDDDDDDEDEDVSKLLCLRRLQFLLCWIDVTQIVSSKEDTIKTLENMLQDCVSDIKSETSIRIMQELPGVMTLWYVMSLTSFSLMSRCWKKLFVIDYSFEKNTHIHERYEYRYYWMSRVEDEDEEEESTWKQGIVKLAQQLCDAIRNTASSSDENVREMLKSIFFSLNDIRLRLAGTLFKFKSYLYSRSIPQDKKKTPNIHTNTLEKYRYPIFVKR
jgi:hypothetical protein